jgi:hypothetical protein
MAEQQKKTLVEFVNELHKNKGWQKKFEDRKKNKEWKELVEKELSAEDAAIVLSEDQAALDEKLKGKTDKTIVWTATAIVWG